MRLAVALATVVISGCECIGCFDSSTDAMYDVPACVDGYAAGDKVAVTLGVPYNAASDYFYDPSLINAVDMPSCENTDGLEVGSQVTFTLRELPPSSVDSGCIQWQASISPEPLKNAKRLDYGVGADAGVTIAGASASGTLDTEAVEVVRALYTPSKHPADALVLRQLPPLVFTRGIYGDADLPEPTCYDAWVATLDSDQ